MFSQFTLQDLGSLGEFVGALGVVISLVYLARQMNQNTTSVRAASFNSMTENSIRLLEPSFPDFLVPRQIEGTLPLDLGPTAGKLLVLSLHEVLESRSCQTPGYTGFSSECATMVVLERDGPELGRRPGRLTLSAPRAGTYYPWGNHTLGPEAEGT